jgi:adenosine deaminase
MSSLTLEIIRELPKAELHCHLDGFVRPATVIALAREQGVALPTFDLDDLKKLIVCPMDCPDLVTYLQCFDIVLKVMQQPYAITRVLFEACEDAVRDGITYIELRFAPALHTKNNHSYSQILEAAIQGCLLAAQRLPITPRIICCAMRHMNPEVNAEIAEICWRYRHSYVVGFDLAGPESGFPPHKHVKAFRTVRRKSLSVTIHAGEAYGARSVKLALQCSAQRIGHGTRIFEDPRVLAEVVDRRIPLEICVSSNLQTKAIQKLEDHPVKRLFDLGARTVPCTDNPTVSGVTLSGEYLILHQQFGFGVPDLLKLIDFGFRSAFVDESMKTRLRIEAFLKAVKVLEKHGIDLRGQLNELYYGRLGLTVPPVFHPPVKIPPLPLPVLQLLPKADLDCRLLGSIPMPVMHKLYSELPEDERKALPALATFKDFATFLADGKSRLLRSDLKNFAISLLQTEENLRQAVRALLYEAFVDNVVYLELTVCPLYHTRKKLTMENVMDYLLDECEKFKVGHPLSVGIVINANVEKLNPLDVHQLASLAVAYHGRGVVGFATTTAEIGVAHMRFFEASFDYLSENFVPVTMFAGDTDPDSVPCALSRGQARRISGGFKITKSESLLSDVTSHNTAVLISQSPLENDTVHGWKRSVVRYFTDFGVKLAFCTIHHTFSGMSRSQQLFLIGEQAGFDALGLLQFIDRTFTAALLPYKDRVALQEAFWKKSQEILSDYGFPHTIDYTYFPPLK